MKIKKSKMLRVRVEEPLYNKLKELKNFSEFIRELVVENLTGELVNEQ